MAIRTLRDLVAPPKKVSVGEDVIRAYVGGLGEGGISLIGGAGDALEFGKRLPQLGVKFLEDRGVVPKGASDHVVQALKFQKIPGPIDILSGVAKAGMKKSAISGGASEEQAQAIANLVPGINRLPTSQDLSRALRADKAKYVPQTTAGDYARTAGQFTPSVIFPGTGVQRAANVVAPAMVSETAGQLTEGTPLEPWARVAGAVAGGVGAGIATGPRSSTRLLSEYARGATDDQLAMAQALREDAARRGITLTQAEAVQQVTGNGTGLGTMQRVLEGTRAGSDRIGPVMAQRPEQTRAAVMGFADSVAPQTAQPSMIGAEAQRAAGTAINDARRRVNARAEPFYRALENQAVPAERYQQFVADPTYRAALAEIRGHPELNASIAHLPDENLSVVNEVVKRMRGMAETATPNPANPMGNHQLEAIRTASAGRVDGAMRDMSTPWTRAHETVARGRQLEVEPLQRGPLGAISATDSVPAQTRALFPNQPLEGAPAETARALREIVLRNPEAGRDLGRQHIVNSYNEAGQALQSGQNQWGGAKWAAQVAGNPEQERTLLAGIDAMGADSADLQGLVRALRATGTRQAPGSMTAYNMEELRNLGRPGAAGQILSTGLNPPGAFRRMGDAFKNWQLERNADNLAQAILATPEEATQILMHARQVVPPGRALTEIERLAATANQGRLPAEQPVR